MRLNNRRMLTLLTAVFTLALTVNLIISGSGITLAVMAVSAVYASLISYKIDKEKGEYQ